MKNFRANVRAILAGIVTIFPLSVLGVIFTETCCLSVYYEQAQAQSQKAVWDAGLGSLVRLVGPSDMTPVPYHGDGTFYGGKDLGSGKMRVTDGGRVCYSREGVDAGEVCLDVNFSEPSDRLYSWGYVYEWKPERVPRGWVCFPTCSKKDAVCLPPEALNPKFVQALKTPPPNDGGWNQVIKFGAGGWGPGVAP